MQAQASPITYRRDMLVGLGFCLVNVAAHLFWNGITTYWMFIVSALVMAAVLIIWLVFEWRGLKLAMTKFYCAAAAFDLLAEGYFQDVHKCTSDNILCTGRMYVVFLVGWLITAGWGLFRSRSNAPLAPPPPN